MWLSSYPHGHSIFKLCEINLACSCRAQVEYFDFFKCRKSRDTIPLNDDLTKTLQNMCAFKETESRDFLHFYIKILYLGPTAYMNRQKWCCKILRFCEDIHEKRVST